VQSVCAINDEVTVTTTVRFDRARKGIRKLVETDAEMPQDVIRGRLPRVTRLMALAIHFDELIRSGEIENYAEIARLGNVTRARVTQIMNLLNLAPEIHEWLLYLPRVEKGRDPVVLRELQEVATEPDWTTQQACRIVPSTCAQSVQTRGRISSP